MYVLVIYLTSHKAAVSYFNRVHFGVYIQMQLLIISSESIYV